MELKDKISIHFMKCDLQDIDAWIDIAEGDRLLDKIARIPDLFRFKSNKDWAKFLKLLKRQKEEKIKLVEKHAKEKEDLYQEFREGGVGKKYI